MSSTPPGEGAEQAERYTLLAAGIGLLLSIGFSQFYSYPLFHTLVELLRIVVVFSIFIIAWHSRRWSGNGYLLFIGIAYLFVAIAELLHVLTYKGVGIFTGYDANLPTQLWLGFRYLESTSLLVAGALIGRRLNVPVLVGGYFVATAALLAAIFSGAFPDAYVEGEGLTAFKIMSEYVVALVFLVALGTLLIHRQRFDRAVLMLLVASFAADIAAELAFTQYVNVYGLANEIGHLLLLLSTYCLYRAIVVTGLVRPFHFLLRDFKQREEDLEARVVERTADLRRAAMALAAGNHSARALDNPGDSTELGDLTRSFNAMASALQVSERALRNASAQKSRFLAVASHDLRQPLHSLMNWLEIARRVPASEARPYLEHARDSAKRLQEQLDGLAEIVRRDAAGSELTPRVRTTALDPLFRRLSAIYTPIADAKHIRLTIVPSRLVVATDQESLSIILNNLIDNALKYTERGRVLVGCRRGGAVCRIEVHDTGCGIPEDQLSSVFRPFYRVETVRERGLGLGLAIVKETADTLRHPMHVTSQPGKGSCFSIELPIARGEYAQD